MRRLGLLLLILLSLGGAAVEGGRYLVRVSAADAPTPSPGAMTVYEVVNANGAPLSILHEIQNLQATPVWSFSDTVPAASSSQYHARDMAQIPSPFDGQVVLSADSPFTAAVVDYDYPPTATPTSTATRMATATASPTRTATATTTPTPTQVVIWLPFRK